VGGFTNGVVSSHVTLSIFGLGFGAVGFSVRVHVGRILDDLDMNGGSASLSSLWVSFSAVLCKPSAGAGSVNSRRVGLPIIAGLQQGSKTSAWSYDVCVVSSVGGLTNSATSGHASLTVAGSGFGLSSYSVSSLLGSKVVRSIHFGGSSLSTTFWMSSSSIFSKHVSGSHLQLSIVVSAASRFGSLSSSFSYDSLKLIRSTMLGARSGSVFIVIASSLSHASPSSKVSLFTSSLELSMWLITYLTVL
jgi:hypothetical protein